MVEILQRVSRRFTRGIESALLSWARTGQSSILLFSGRGVVSWRQDVSSPEGRRIFDNPTVLA
jgi:lipid-A-disaccharide synthase-like uncharacterized protein